MSDRTYYLSSLESDRFKPVRECVLVETIHFDTGKEAVVGWLDPPVIGQASEARPT